MRRGTPPTGLDRAGNVRAMCDHDIALFDAAHERRSRVVSTVPESDAAGARLLERLGL